MELRIDFKFNSGDLVASNHIKKMGIITKQWSKIVKVNNQVYQLTKSYTVQPEKGQQFKAEEDELELIE